MATIENTKMPWVGRLLPTRLSYGFGVIVCVAVLITEVLFLIPAAYYWHKSNQRDAVEQVRLAWYHASDPAAFLSAVQKTRLGERMLRDGLVLGGVIYDSAGDPLAVFGERPVLDLNIARLSGVSVQPSPSSPALDVHFSPEETGLAHHMVVRLPTAPIEAETFAEVRNFGLSVLFIAGFTAFLFMIACAFFVVRPLRAINVALRKAVENPDQADMYRLPVKRRDELGQIATSLNMLLTSVSVVYQDELASMKRAIDGFGYAIIQFDAAERIVSANPAALKAFQCEDFESLRSMNRNCASPLGAQRSVPQPLISLLGETSEPMLVTIHNEIGFFTAMAYAVAIRRPDGSPISFFVSIVLMDDVLAESRKAMVTAKKAENTKRLLQVEVQEMRRLLESCLCLLEPAKLADERVEESVLPDRILNAWYSDAVRDGLVSGKLEHGLLPYVKGDASAIRNVLRQSMLLVYSQTKIERPFLKVTAQTNEDDQVVFTICDISNERTGGGAKRTKGVDPTLPRAALARAISSVGGQLVGADNPNDPSSVRFVLRSGVDVLDPGQRSAA